MNHQDVTVSNMQWLPPLIMVHQIADDGGSTVAFADPAHIRMIRRGVSRTSLPGKQPSDDWVECTVMHLANGDSLCVTEAPEVIAKLRDAAFGHKYHESTLSVVGEK